MPQLNQPLRKRTHFYRRSPKLHERKISLRDVQDSHRSRRIFFSDFAKTLNRNSRSTRSRPRAPISRPNSGLASSASSEVASCPASPCCTRYPVFPSSITSGAPPCAPPITGLPHAAPIRHLLEPFLIITFPHRHQLHIRPLHQQARQCRDQCIHSLIALISAPP